MNGLRWLFVFLNPQIDDPREHIRKALAGDRAAGRQLLARLLPVLHARAGRCLAKAPRAVTGLPDEEDLVQEVWLALLEHDGRALLGFDPARGVTLEGYIGMVAERSAVDILRRNVAKKRGGDHVAADPDDAHALVSYDDPAQDAEARDLAARLGEHLKSRLPHIGRLTFRYIYTDGLAPAATAETLGVNIQVIYNWQHRIREHARTFLAQASA